MDSPLLDRKGALFFLIFVLTRNGLCIGVVEENADETLLYGALGAANLENNTRLDPRGLISTFCTAILCQLLSTWVTA